VRSTKLFVIKKNGTFRPVSLEKHTESFTDFRKNNISLSLTCKRIGPSSFFCVFSHIFWKAHGIENRTTFKHSEKIRYFCCGWMQVLKLRVFFPLRIPPIDRTSSFDYGRWVDRAPGPQNRDAKWDQNSFNETSISLIIFALSHFHRLTGGRQSKRLPSLTFIPSTALNIGESVFRIKDRISFLRHRGKNDVICDGILGENVSEKSRPSFILVWILMVILPSYPHHTHSLVCLFEGGWYWSRLKRYGGVRACVLSSRRSFISRVREKGEEGSAAASYLPFRVWIRLRWPKLRGCNFFCRACAIVLETST